MPFNFCSAPGRNCYIWTPLCWSPICPLLPLMGHRHPVQAAAEMWAGQVKEMGLTKAWLGGESKSPSFQCLKSLGCYLSSPGHASTTEKSTSGLQYAPVLPCCMTAMHTNHDSPGYPATITIESRHPSCISACPLPTNLPQQPWPPSLMYSEQAKFVFICVFP